MLSIIIPAYNEEKRIGKTLDSLIGFFDGKDENYELIVSANGCKDGTEDLAIKYNKKNKKIKLVSSRTPAKGLALQRGFNSSKGSTIIFADADSSSGPEEIWKLIQGLKNYDVVIGSRAVKHLIKIRQPWRREAFGKLMSLIVRLLFRIGIYDTQCGYKAFKREVLEKVFNSVSSKGFEFDVELLLKIKKAGFTIKELPIRWDDDNRSTLKIYPDAFRMFLNILKLRARL